ncbi:MAG TPA: hypothetical protein VJ853_02365 [Thermoanaerobaculia bacterium]|nr:hypothetical protein [Thermoanaerobaculia bacterium]
MIKRYVPLACRLVAAALLAYLSIAPIQHGGHERVAGVAEIAGVILFAVPRVWRAGGALLLVVIAVVFLVHSIDGHPPLMLIFPALLIVLLLAGAP